MTKEVSAGYSIAAVERDTGLSKDVLRVWERRYGFPLPHRDAHGERLYPLEQVERLRVIRRLMDAGHRPGRLLSLPEQDLQALVSRSRAAGPGRWVRPDVVASVEALPPLPDSALQPLFALIREHRMTDYRDALEQRLARVGLRLFVQDTVAPMAAWVGEAWAAGELQVHEEHLFTEHTERALRRAIDAVPGGAAPRVLLTTAPHEPHVLGLLMAEATLALEGAYCMSLGTQLPAADIAGAARAHQADVVALSFSAAYPIRQLAAFAATLREALPLQTTLWIGGAGAARAATLPDGVRRLNGLDELMQAVARWRAEQTTSLGDTDAGLPA